MSRPAVYKTLDGGPLSFSPEQRAVRRQGEKAMNRATRFIGCVMAWLVMAAAPPVAATVVMEPTGLIVEGFVADSAAAKAGVKVGDVLLTFEGRELTTIVNLQAVQQNSVGKREGALQVRRGETTLTLSVPIGSLGILVRPELPPSALTLYIEGRAAVQAEKYGEAINGLVKSAEEAEKGGAHAAAAWLYWSAGSIQEGQERWNEALKLHASAWKLVSGSRDAALKVKVLGSLGWCSQNLANYTEAAKWHEQALRLNEGAGYEIWAAEDLTSLGRVALDTRDYQTAHDLFDRALKIYERLKPQSGVVASSLSLLATVTYFSSGFKAAQDYQPRALKIYEQLDAGSEDTARSYNNLGSIAFKRGALGEAQKHFQRALELRERIKPDSLDVADTLSNLGGVAYFLGDMHAAQVNHRRAFQIRKKLAPGSRLEAASLNSQGNIFYSAGNLPSAQEFYDDALKIQLQVDPGSLEVAISLNNLGNIAYFSNRLDEAQDYHRRAFEIRARLAPGSLEVADSLNNLGSIAYSRGDLTAAKGYHRRALEIRDQLAPARWTSLWASPLWAETFSKKVTSARRSASSRTPWRSSKPNGAESRPSRAAPSLSPVTCTRTLGCWKPTSPSTICPPPSPSPSERPRAALANCSASARLTSGAKSRTNWSRGKTT